jgi:hypothetical protein
VLWCHLWPQNPRLSYRAKGTESSPASTIIRSL